MLGLRVMVLKELPEENQPLPQSILVLMSAPTRKSDMTAICNRTRECSYKKLDIAAICSRDPASALRALLR